jgi:hypothetical protein
MSILLDRKFGINLFYHTVIWLLGRALKDDQYLLWVQSRMSVFGTN